MFSCVTDFPSIKFSYFSLFYLGVCGFRVVHCSIVICLLFSSIVIFQCCWFIMFSMIEIPLYRFVVFISFDRHLLLIVLLQFEGRVMKVVWGEYHGRLAIGERHGRLAIPSSCPPLLWSAPVGARRLRGWRPSACHAPLFNRTDTICWQIKMGMVAYLGGDHHMFNKTDRTCQQVNLGMVAYLGAVLLCRPCMWVQILSSCCYVSQVSRQTYIETMQPRPFEEWIEKGHGRDTNLLHPKT